MYIPADAAASRHFRVRPLEHLARRDPDAGLRRHLIVLLAGSGEHDAVATLAAGDPDAHVRATAAQYLARLAEARPSSWPLVVERLGDADPIVRETLVLQLGASAPAQVRATPVDLCRTSQLWERQVLVVAEKGKAAAL